MANAIILGGGGGGTSSDELTAVAGDVLLGKTYVGQDSNDEPKAGTMPDNKAWTGSVGRNSSVTIPAGYHNGNGKVTGPSITDKAAATYNPTSTAQTIVANQYLTGAQTIAAVSQTNLAAGNIKTGVTITIKGGTTNIWSVAGTFCSDATLNAANQMLSGKVGYGAGGTRYSGTIPSKQGQTVTPTTAQQVVTCSGNYMTGNITISAIPSTFVQTGVRTNFFNFSGAYFKSGNFLLTGYTTINFSTLSSKGSNVYAGGSSSSLNNSGTAYLISRPFPANRLAGFYITGSATAYKSTGGSSIYPPCYIGYYHASSMNPTSISVANHYVDYWLNKDNTWSNYHPDYPQALNDTHGWAYGNKTAGASLPQTYTDEYPIFIIMRADNVDGRDAVSIRVTTCEVVLR